MIYYQDIDSTKTTTQTSKLTYTKRDGAPSFQEFSLAYAYDSTGNITSVTGTTRTDQTASYTYDKQGQLLTENSCAGKWTYTYDTYGNICKATNGTTIGTHTYTYGDSDWLDLLTAYDEHPITYDTIGNPTSYYNGTQWTFGWSNGRQLASASTGRTTISYTYDAAGIRDSKMLDGTTKDSTD